MPLQNRVTPYGEISSSPAQGTLLGNRGILHDDGRNIVRQWHSQLWIHCVLEFKGRRRSLMKPGTYTELFFLDEPTALAAGHRPCGECQRSKHQAFKSLMEEVHEKNLGPADMNRILHSERLKGPRNSRTKRTFKAELASLPEFTMVAIEGEAHVVREAALLPWSADGYGQPVRFDSIQEVDVLTPVSIVEVLRKGYDPTPGAKTST